MSRALFGGLKPTLHYCGALGCRHCLELSMVSPELDSGKLVGPVPISPSCSTLKTVVRSGGRVSLSTLIHLQPQDRTPMKSSKSNTKIPVATIFFVGIPGQHVPDSIGLKKEEAGLRCGGRGKSEISSALRMCSNEQYITKLYAKLYFFC